MPEATLCSSSWLLNHFGLQVPHCFRFATSEQSELLHSIKLIHIFKHPRWINHSFLLLLHWTDKKMNLVVRSFLANLWHDGEMRLEFLSDFVDKNVWILFSVVFCCFFWFCSTTVPPLKCTLYRYLLPTLVYYFEVNIFQHFIGPICLLNLCSGGVTLLIHFTGLNFTTFLFYDLFEFGF